MIYFGWLTVSKFVYYQQPGDGLGPEASVQPAPPPGSAESQDRPPPLDEYHVVWDRNLLVISASSQAAAKREKIVADNIAVAGKEVGLKLIGTVVTNDPKLNYAIIDVVATRDQRIFREKERVGKAVIKAILRNNVIIETEDGRRKRLTELEMHTTAYQWQISAAVEEALKAQGLDFAAGIKGLVEGISISVQKKRWLQAAASALVPIATGVRWVGTNEYSVQFGAPGFTTLEGTYDYWMPNFDFNIEGAEDMILRASYSKTIGRPGWGDIQGGQTLNGLARINGGNGQQGNPGLKPLESQNYDLSYEWYYGEGSYFSVGYFFKGWGRRTGFYEKWPISASFT